MKCSWLALMGALAMGCSASGGAEQLGWPQWRGPQRDGRLIGFTVPRALPSNLVKRWERKIGEGHSSPVTSGGRAFVLTREGDVEVTSCMELKSGKLVWQDRTPAPFDSVIFPARRLGKSPRSTPLVHQGKLYVIGVNGSTRCLNAQTGAALWRRDFSIEFPTPMPICGASLSPLIDGKKLYVHVGHDEVGAFLALDKDTGKTIWSARGEGPAYTSPQLATLDGKRQIVTASHNTWMGLDPETGTLLWSIRVRQNMFNHNSITPVVDRDVVYCGGNQRSTLALRVKKRGNIWIADRLWETRDVTMSTSSPILDGNRLFAVNEKRRGQLVSMDIATGRVIWACDGDKGEQVSLYDGGTHLLAFTFDGTLLVYAKAGSTLRESARYALLDGTTWASPAFDGNLILVKGADTLTLWELPLN